MLKLIIVNSCHDLGGLVAIFVHLCWVLVRDSSLSNRGYKSGYCTRALGAGLGILGVVRHVRLELDEGCGKSCLG